MHLLEYRSNSCNLIIHPDLVGSDIISVECSETPTPTSVKTAASGSKSATGFIDSEIASRSSASLYVIGCVLLDATLIVDMLYDACIIFREQHGELVRWQAEDGDGNEVSLRDERYKEGSWDQFRANEELFNIGETTYSDVGVISSPPSCCRTSIPHAWMSMTQSTR